jgi:protocatechuate 3,4-dioxygenase beta subunit
VRAEGVGSRILLVPAIGHVGAAHDLGEVRLARGRTLAGRVLDAAGGPQAGAEVTLAGPAREGGVAVDDRLLDSYGTSDVTRTDDLGRFRFVDVEPGRYVLMAVERPPVRASRDVDLTADADRLDETLTLPPRRRLRIEPVDDQGKTVFPVYARFRWDGGKREDGLWDPRELEVLLPGKVRGLILRLNAMNVDGVVNPEPLTVADDATHVRVVFRRVPVMAGRLLDELGKPLGRALVGAWRDGECIESATTEEDGAFTMGIEGTALFDLRFEGRVYGVSETTWFEEVAKPIGAELRDVRPGAQGLELVARPVPADLTLEIRVLDLDGAPAAGLPVSVTPRMKGAADDLRTDAAGRIALADLPPTRLTIRADVPEERRDLWWSPRLTQVLPSGQTVTLRLVRPRFVEGTIVNAKGAPLPGATVRAEFWDAAAESREADAQGRFRLPLDPEGDATVDLESFSQDAAGTKWWVEVGNVPVGGAPVRLVAEPHDGIGR